MNIDWLSFSPVPALAGGALIGLAAALFVLLLGRVAGISGSIGALFKPQRGDRAWRIAFVAGLVVSPWAYALLTQLPAIEIQASWGTTLLAGVLVGLGTRYGAGCTSGHGVCGLARLSPRSLVAVIAFMLAGFVTVALMRHLMV
ncbi:MAG: YeeE/YedE family protein [Burkholderiales bacterium]